MGHLARSTIELAERVIQLQTDIEQRQQRMRQGRITFDGISHVAIEGSVSELRWEFDAEDFKQSTDFVLQIQRVFRILCQRKVA